MTVTEKIEQRLFALQDEKYRLFQSKLMPGIPLERIIGVRTPLLRSLAKELKNADGIEDFLNDIPHKYYDENNLHGFIISECKDYKKAVEYVDKILPFVDNWATCDLLSPKVFKKHRDILGKDIERWLNSDKTYTVRFGIEMIMSHYLDEDFDEKWLKKVADVKEADYYVNMMVAWFFATALAKQWDKTVPYIEDRKFPAFIQNKTVQKAVESYRITEEQKTYLRTLKIK